MTHKDKENESKIENSYHPTFKHVVGVVRDSFCSNFLARRVSLRQDAVVPFLLDVPLGFLVDAVVVGPLKRLWDAKIS
jgi:hypothetical protein